MPINGGSQGNPKNSGGEKPQSDSSTETDVDLKGDEVQDPADKDKSGSPSNEEIAAIRHDARYRERRQLVKTLRDQGFDVTSKNLDTFLKGLNPDKLNPKSKTDKSKDDPRSKSKSEDDDESETVKLLRQQLEEVKRNSSTISETAKATIIDGAIARATAGVNFANEDAASDAIAAFERLYTFELADDNRTVRILDRDGEPVMDGYKEATLKGAFKDFIDKRPHFKKAEKKPGTNIDPKKGLSDVNKGINQLFREQLGLK
jgi:hypothetical protein